jgi:putative transposase
MEDVLENELDLEIAKFRFGIIAEFVTGVRFARGERESLLKEKVGRIYTIPGSNRTSISEGSISTWIRLYRASGNDLKGLMPAVRKDKGQFRSLTVDIRMALKDLKHEMPEATLPTLIKKLREKHILSPDQDLDSATCYRFLSTINIENSVEANADRRSFEALYPNALWQCDVMHGPMVSVAAKVSKKAYLIAILDDHSRLITYSAFYLNENKECLRHCLKNAIQRRGVPQKYYVDNGSCYRSQALENTCAWLSIQLVHSRPYTPQGRGKIERFFRTVRESFLQEVENKTLSLGQLNERWDDWVDSYNQKEHGTTKMTPLKRYTADMTSVRPAPPQLEDHFRDAEQRLVKKNRTVALGGVEFEVPQGLIGKKVELRFEPENREKVEVFYHNHSYGFATKLNVHLNSTLGRDFGSTQKLYERNPEKAPANGVEPVDKPAIQGGQLFGRAEVTSEL